MKTIEEFLGGLALRLGDLYQRPLMHGGTADGVELLLHNYHSLWAEIVEQHEEFCNVWHAVLAEQDCGAANFSTHYARRHPNASEQEILAYVLEHWKEISTRLSVPIQTPAYPAKQRHFCIGDRVQLISFNSTTTPPPDCDDAENYWKLIGSSGIIHETPSNNSRLLVLFDVDVESLGLHCHNPIPNTLLILASDLVERY